ncbi:carbamoyltransferase family protein [Candidatus Pelagibacter communis]|uniref:carbamoyltransferase family protein n=1 Tax=Pelagibacter ubique TaxID=198252 RepID=UPI00094C49C1|nr:carbamoyltransferase [Candidatus Pelagibacter ubique]
MTSILGISAFYHDSAAALIIDGEIVAAAQEERFSRKKHDARYPINAINYVLSEAKIKLSDIDHIVFFEKPFLKFERLLETYMAFAPKGFKSFSLSMPIWLREKLFQKKFLFDNLKSHDEDFKDINKIKFSEHHYSHAASAFYPSPFKEAIVLTLDGVGEWATTTVAIGKENKLNMLKEIHFPHSLGLLYSAFTYYTGFKVNSGEYKVMGLAPYGKPKYKDLIIKELMDLKEDGSFKLNMKYFNYATGLTMTNKKFSNLFGQPVRNSKKDLLTDFHMDIASSIQAVTEEVVLRLTRDIVKEYKIKNLCLAGGVALNCVANGKILRKNYFENIWIQPAAGDAGGSLGAALAYWHRELDKPRKDLKDKMKGAYLGPRHEASSIERNLKSLKAVYKEKTSSEISSQVAKELANSKTVGWFQGRMEFGPRALGARSILADPRSEKMQKELNLKIKFRESFRPFAPSVLREDVKEWFEIDYDSPYMLLVSDVKKEKQITMSEKDNKLFGIDKLNIKRSSIPAITHVDYSARIQTVHKETNPKYYDLINEFKKITNCPVLVNTSFNVRGEPIVCSVEDAFNCFMGTNLDVLVIENFVLFKEDQDKSLLKDYKNKFELD